MSRALSSAGRAPALQAGGHRFEPYSAHHLIGLLKSQGDLSADLRQGFRMQFASRPYAQISQSCDLVKTSDLEKSTAKYGPVVQLVRMPACHAGGRRFEPVPDRHFF